MAKSQQRFCPDPPIVITEIQTSPPPLAGISKPTHEASGSPAVTVPGKYSFQSINSKSLGAQAAVSDFNFPNTSTDRHQLTIEGFRSLGIIVSCAAATSGISRV
jgi:hypothetical protein